MTSPLDNITLDRLFRPTKVISFLGANITVRALSDPERTERYRLAMLARAELNRKLDDPNSEEYAIHIRNAAYASDDEMRSAVMIFRMREAERRIEKDNPYRYIPFPDNASPDESVRILNERQDMVSSVDKKRSELLTEALKSIEESLSTKSREQLDIEYIKAIRERLLTSVFGDETVAQTIRLSTNGHFSREDALNLHPAMRDKLWLEIAEVDNIDPLALSGLALTGSSPERTA